MKITSKNFTKLLQEWYAHHRRDLPWRRTHDPYKIWVSEIMLQQTQVERVKDFYARFLKKFPSVQELAQGSWEEVLDCWRGLGYYRRARNMHETAKILTRDFGGKFPQKFQDLQKLPGIGQYTAAAIASFAFGEKVPAIDTNFARVFTVVFGELWCVKKPPEKFEFARKYIDPMNSRDFNYAIMDLGSTQEYKLPRQSRGLVLADKTVDVKVAAGVLIHEGKILISQRPKGKVLAGLWEFPGGKIENREDERQCLKREMQEELDVEVAVRPAFYKTRTEHDGVQILLTFHRCSLLLGTPRALEKQTFRWVTVAQLRNYEFPEANKEVLEILEAKPAMLRG